MSDKTQKVKKLPGVLAFQRRHIVTDGLMYNEIEGNFELHPLPVIRHGIRATQNINDGKAKAETGTASKGGRIEEVSNIQITDSAKLDPDADALIVIFSIRFLDIDNGIDSCVAADKDDGKLLKDSLADFIQRAKSSEGLQEVTRRYARNIANGRWLWRNRTIANDIEIFATQNDYEIASFNALSIALNRFENYSEEERRLGEILALGLLGESNHIIKIKARLSFGFKGSVEIFPSQNYIEEKPRGFARSLFRIGPAERIKKNELVEFRKMGQAALRDQKIFNAIRTIDTWYQEFMETNLPIAIEPKGASLSQQRFYRPKEYSSFEMFKRLYTIDPNSPDGMFCIAALDRGGVYSESDKKDKNSSTAELNDAEDALE